MYSHIEAKFGAKIFGSSLLTLTEDSSSDSSSIDWLWLEIVEISLIRLNLEFGSEIIVLLTIWSEQNIMPLISGCLVINAGTWARMQHFFNHIWTKNSTFDIRPHVYENKILKKRTCTQAFHFLCWRVLFLQWVQSFLFFMIKGFMKTS